MRIAAIVWICAAAAAGCGNKNGGPGGGTGTGTGGGGGDPARCDQIREHVEALYRAEAEPAATSASSPQTPATTTVADNVAMVLGDCAAAPDRVATCAAAAKTVADLEARCLIPLDDEGSEGDRFGAR